MLMECLGEGFMVCEGYVVLSLKDVVEVLKV